MCIMKMKCLLPTAIIFCGISLRLGLVHAQPPEKPQADAAAAKNTPNFKLTQDNLKATAMMGAFYNAIQRASAYHGHFVFTKTVVNGGKVIHKKVVDWQSTWLGDGNGNFRLVVEARFTTTEGEGVAARTTVKKMSIVDDGKMQRTFDPVKNIWSEKKQPFGQPDMATFLSQAAWTTMLVAFSLGNEFTVSNRISNVEPQQQIAVTNQTNNFEYVFDAATGNLRVWRVSSGNGETTELRWSELELNQAPAPKVFEWIPPVGARQVPPKENERKFEF